jgi:hypothetical protein
MSIAKSNIQLLWQRESTLFVKLTDCAGKDLGTQELYVNDISTAQLSSLTDADFNAFHAPLKNLVKGNVYVKESTYSNEQHLCAVFYGGSITGAKVWSSQFKIK